MHYSLKRIKWVDRTAAVLLILSLFVWTVGFTAWINWARAGTQLDAVSITLSDSRPSPVTATSTIKFTHFQNLVETDTIKIIYPGGFNLSSVLAGNIICPTNSTGSVSGQTITCTVGAAGITAGERTVTVGNIVNATVSGGVPTSYEIEIRAGTSGEDDREFAFTRVVILDPITVTARINTTFTLTVSGVASGQSINGSPNTGAGATATALPFGTLNAGTDYVLGQELTVATNASDGFLVTLEQDGNLRSATGDYIRPFKDGTPVTTPEAWANPTGTLDQPNTYGHIGFTTNDADLNDHTPGTDDYTSGKYGGFDGTTPRPVFAHNGPSDGTTQNKGLARVALRVRITALQPAADDYQQRLMYIATPTF